MKTKEKELEKKYLIAQESDDVELLYELLKNEDKKVLHRLAANKNIDNYIINHLIVMNDKYILRILAQNEALNVIQIYYLSRHADVEVKKYIASNNSTPAEILFNLAGEVNPEIICNVLDSKNITQNIFEKIFNNFKINTGTQKLNGIVGYFLAKNKFITKNQLNEIYEKTTNPEIKQQILKKLKKEFNYEGSIK